MPRKKRTEVVTLTQLHRELHSILRKVKAGTKIVVTEYGQPEYKILQAGRDE